ncbi:hypothetical protein ACFONG_20180 [Uliginosibacterium paludis]|jgi:hypothetical protein|uniref:Uncharacterized protein n=1 Tax=Uliginosibacterium paludis TaxID=1615952 RepID=A0ABV2CVG8_9RHOO
MSLIDKPGNAADIERLDEENERSAYMNEAQIESTQFGVGRDTLPDQD